MNILWGVIGILVILGIALLFSVNRRAIKLRTVLIALAIQIFFAFTVLKWETGR
ncbi:concentrative nucleoside transporter, CNT family [Piscibacillus halophilus]|uniref:Concentrative nucleoside transporter, CNT family n=2 Tax=Piscibacillus halophilus TaxID=571933 RepID=A0A1H9JVJ8_9BACI|nr:concentrative nucleoside transporter, CNT family [Piscibacillus halophilus]